VSSAASVEGDAHHRLFLALELPDDTRAAVAAWAEREIATGRRVREADLHVTLAFLGRRPVAELPLVLEALEAAVDGGAELPLAVSAWRETRSVGMLVLDDPTARARALAASLRARLVRIGVIDGEQRPWLPHVTVVRHRHAPRLRPTLPAMGTFVPSDAAAYVSRLHPGGARYAVLARVPLHPPEPRRNTG
jgi:2'-5' RNA ligase